LVPALKEPAADGRSQRRATKTAGWQGLLMQERLTAKVHSAWRRDGSTASRDSCSLPLSAGGCGEDTAMVFPEVQRESTRHYSHRF